ncbi:MAG: DUF1428 domain-containing protein [Ferrovibrio sp.]
MSYVDGFLIPVPKKKLAAYMKMAAKAGKIWMEFGAVAYYECAGDDMNPAFGLPFPKLMKLKKGEVPVFSFIIYKSKAQRDRVNVKIMKDPRMQAMCPDPKKMPFDVKRMGYGGFKAIVKA